MIVQNDRLQKMIQQQKAARVVMLGATSVGKTTLIDYIIKGTYNPLTAPTAAAAFFEYKSSGPNPKTIHIWDTAGMERYRAMNSVYYRDAIGALLVFDLTNKDSFDELEGWLTTFITNSSPNPVIILIGNKKDLGDNIEVTEEEIQQFSDKHNLKYFSTSALTGDGVREMFDALIEMLPDTIAETVELPPKSGCC